MSKAKGFTAIEAVISVCILSIVGLLIGQTVLQIGRSATHSSQSGKAATLSAMVLEQYKAYAAQDYSQLASHDQDHATPQAFFQTRDNLGYDSLRITTHTETRPEGGMLVKVIISWGGGTEQEQSTYSQSFGERAGRTTEAVMSGL